MGELLSSKTVSRREPPRVRTLRGGASAVLCAVGVTEKGPVNSPTTITSWDEFVRIFGNEIVDSDTAHSIRGYFGEGGTQLRFVRIVHYTDIDDPLTKTSAAASLNLSTDSGAATAGSVLGTVTEPFNLEPGDDLDVAIDGAGAATATFTAAAASQTSGNTETFALANSDELDIEIDGGATQTVQFLTSQFVDIANATAAEVAAVINGQIVGASADVSGGAVVITSDHRGTGSGVQVTGGTANTAGKLNFPTTLASGTGNVADIDAVTAAEVKTIVEAAVAGCTVTSVGGAVQIASNTTGISSSVQVEAGSTADDELGLDNATHVGTTGAAQLTAALAAKWDGALGNSLSIDIEDATNGDAEHFNLVVKLDGAVVERWPNLTMDSTAERYAETVINTTETTGDDGSNWITFTDLEADGSVLNRRPVNGTGLGPMSGGNDGLTSLADTDFIGSSAGETGLYALDTVNDGTLLAVPGRATSAVHNAMITYAEVWRDGKMFCLLDPPANTGAAGMKTYVESTASLLNLSEFGAMYWPEVTVINPNKDLFGQDDDLVVPPSGHIAGMIARMDGSSPGGRYKQPAGKERGLLRTITGIALPEANDERKRDIVYPARINPIRTDGARYVDGSRTLKGNGNFPSVGESRTVIYIDTTVTNGIDYARHEDNTDELGRQIERDVKGFLRTAMLDGAFRTKNPSTAFFVDFGPGLNPESVIFLNERRGRIGLATKKPAEFFVIGYAQDTRALEQEIAG